MPTILHLSDLHRTPNDLETQLRILRETAVKHAVPDRYDFVVVSGDLVDRPTEAEYKNRLSFIAKHLRPLLRTNEERRIVVVPGNHDVAYEEGDRALIPVALCDNPPEWFEKEL